MPKLLIMIAGILGASAVAMGAYHAHGLKQLLEKRFGRVDGATPMIPSDDPRYRDKYDVDEDGQMNAAEVDTYVAYLLQNGDTAVKYQMYHALAIFGIGILILYNGSAGGNALLGVAAMLMLIGVVGFSGGLYSVVFDWIKLHPLVIPAGGMLMILGWLTLVFGALFVSDA